MLSDTDLSDLAAWRRRLHAMPELSGEEAQTAREVAQFLAATGPADLVTGLGGHGVAAVYAGAQPGPTLLFRAELDALPIEERSDLPYRSGRPGHGHLCGHDGHMASLGALARLLGRAPPARGRAVLLFQPAEEDGAGAARVVADPAFAPLRPDMSFAYHNMPGVPLGEARIAEGPVNCASRGMRLVLSGKTAHASQPEAGLSPMAAMARLMPALTALSGGSIAGGDYALLTVTHARLGVAAFGIAPGEGEVWATLRTLTDDGMAGLRRAVLDLADGIAAEAGLGLAWSEHDVFAHCSNAPAPVALLRAAMRAEGVPFCADDLPMRASEDFGRFGQVAPAAMVFLGAGVDHPRLHNPDYDFPDALIGIAARLMHRVLREVLGPTPR